MGFISRLQNYLVEFFGFPKKYGEAMADGSILVPTSFLQVVESSRCSLGFSVICFYAVLRGN
jgi:hypothetical protein